jgi:hypothetical protein
LAKFFEKHSQKKVPKNKKILKSWQFLEFAVGKALSLG